MQGQRVASPFCPESADRCSTFPLLCHHFVVHQSDDSYDHSSFHCPWVHHVMKQGPLLIDSNVGSSVRTSCQVSCRRSSRIVHSYFASLFGSISLLLYTVVFPSPYLSFRSRRKLLTPSVLHFLSGNILDRQTSSNSAFLVLDYPEVAS